MPPVTKSEKIVKYGFSSKQKPYQCGTTTTINNNKLKFKSQQFRPTSNTYNDKIHYIFKGKCRFESRIWTIKLLFEHANIALLSSTMMDQRARATCQNSWPWPLITQLSSALFFYFFLSFLLKIQALIRSYHLVFIFNHG